MSNRAQDFRNFALSNIERVRVLDRTFTRECDFLLREYAPRSFGLFQENPVDVVLKFAPKAAIDARVLVPPDTGDGAAARRVAYSSVLRR
jgi:predicted DNA-binding transcriptional regulator YafY